MNEFLFTYGSLQPGCAPPEIAPVVAALEIAGRGYIFGTLRRVLPYPGVVLGCETDRISGTIYRLGADPEMLRLLDAYEEYFPETPETSHYLRVLHPVHWEEGRIQPCWVYVLNETAPTSD
ncbi:gamma-glutamylcyclotransferase [Acidobacteria bacterium AB60]|nr:gamma-glutamylcyclotransferase [Acidobacteria bacterium AB60]